VTGGGDATGGISVTVVEAEPPVESVAVKETIVDVVTVLAVTALKLTAAAAATEAGTARLADEEVKVTVAPEGIVPLIGTVQVVVAVPVAGSVMDAGEQVSLPRVGGVVPVPSVKA
jgi:hypothetical protein